MLKRKIMERLEKWKSVKSGKSLIIEGALQVGKTFIVREFAKRNYSTFKGREYRQKTISKKNCQKEMLVKTFTRL